MVNHKTIIENVEIINIVKKSKFISIVFPCNSVAEFEEQLASVKHQHKEANHYCYAYRIVDSVLLERYQDDKEPGGTAGLPILSVLKGQDLMDCGIIVARYFGGTKLGTGGLSRAYSDAARDALDLAKIVVKETAIHVEIEVDYHHVGKMEYFISTNSIPLLSTMYDNKVKYEIVIKPNDYNDCIDEFNLITSGQCHIVNEDNWLGYFNDNKFVKS